MDRIEDLAEHISNMEIIEGRHLRCAFDFLDLLNHSAVLVDCIYEIARLYEVNMDEYAKSSDIFDLSGVDGKGSDKKYFEYLRSVCSMHPFETNRHPSYQETDSECCPYVAWNDDKFSEKADLCALIYMPNLTASQ